MSALPERMVLLVLHGNQLDAGMLSPALGLCDRLNAGLEIIAVATDDNLRHKLQDLLSAPGKKSLYWTLTAKTSLTRREIVDYANSHEHIAAVVIDSLQHWENRALDRSSNPWQKLGCPLVTAIHKEIPGNTTP